MFHPHGAGIRNLSPGAVGRSLVRKKSVKISFWTCWHECKKKRFWWLSRQWHNNNNNNNNNKKKKKKKRESDGMVTSWLNSGASGT